MFAYHGYSDIIAVRSESCKRSSSSKWKWLDDVDVSGRRGGSSSGFVWFTLWLLLFAVELLLLLLVVDVSEALAVVEDDGWALAFPVASPWRDVFGNDVEVSASWGGTCDVGVLFMQYLMVASQLFISVASLASMTYSWLSLAFSTNVFSLSGISNGIVCRASDINAQKTPLRGCNERRE